MTNLNRHLLYYHSSHSCLWIYFFQQVIYYLYITSSEYIEQIYSPCFSSGWWAWAAAHVGSCRGVFKYKYFCCPLKLHFWKHMLLKADQQNAQIPVSYQEASGCWRVCGLTEWFKSKTNTPEQDITHQSFVGDPSDFSTVVSTSLWSTVSHSNALFYRQ